MHDVTEQNIKTVEQQVIDSSAIYNNDVHTTEVTVNDVVIGHGRKHHNNKGNVEHRKLLHLHEIRSLSTKKTNERKAMHDEVFQSLNDLFRPCRFVHVNANSQTWVKMSTQKHVKNHAVV